MSIRPDLTREYAAFESGARIVAGIDEVGRGAWAGPVSVGVVAIDAEVGIQPVKLRDSKMVSKSVREALIPEIVNWSLEVAVGHASPAECDQLGMRAAIALASSRALDELTVVPDVVVVDGPLDLLEGNSLLLSELVGEHAWRQTPPQVQPVVKGDQCCASISAASVLAKVTRDHMMAESATSYPAFDFDQNVGYPSPSHQRALRGYGLTAIHRRSWRYLDSIPWISGSAKTPSGQSR